MIYTGSAMLTAIPSQELEDFITAKFYYCLYYYYLYLC